MQSTDPGGFDEVVRLPLLLDVTPVPVGCDYRIVHLLPVFPVAPDGNHARTRDLLLEYRPVERQRICRRTCAFKRGSQTDTNVSTDTIV